jgi:DNA-binding IclR family transcriptional regulator
MMRGVQRTVAVFDCFTPQRMSLTLQEIADTIGLAKSTTFRIVQSLEAAGYLIRLEDQKYCLSFRFTRLAGMVMSTLSIRQVARPMMAALARHTNETVTLNLTTGRDRTCIDVIDTPSPLMSMARPGQHVPLDHKGATAKTLMAHRPLKEQERLVAPAARATKRKPEVLLAELARIRTDGYCYSHGERVLGLSAIAAPILDVSGIADYCITITAPTVRLKPRLNEFVKLLLETSIDISRRLGADQPQLSAPAPRTKKQTAHAGIARRALVVST